MSYTKGYKAFHLDKTCRDFKFEEGKEYKTDGDPILCEKGFHFCKDLVLALEYYPVQNFITENLYAEVEAIGDIVYENVIAHKACTNHIKIVRFLTNDEVLGLVDDKSNSGNWNSGDRNSGDCNSGNWNSGNWNSGNWNSGDRNSGDWNSGNWNSGNWNSGDRNSGDRNSGDRNSGDRNSGNSNSGNWNSGNWNSGNWNSGFFNTETPKQILCFNKLINKETWDSAKKPTFLYFEIRNEESYKDAFQRSWGEARQSEKEKLLNLPGFDKTVFLEISGIDVDNSEDQ